MAAKWRTVHVNGVEWEWVRSKTRMFVVIKDPISNSLREVPFEKIDPAPPSDPSPWTWQYVITPGKVKAYIERYLLDD